MSDAPVLSHLLRLADLPTRSETRVTLTPSPEQTSAIAAALGVSAVRKMRFDATIKPSGKRDWVLAAELGATVVQPCVVTLEPVTTRIEETVTRQYIDGYEVDTEAAEVEMPEDDTIEPLPASIDLGVIATEALALALPLYPRADGAELGEKVFTEPGKDALTDEDVKPFAGLAALRDKLGGTSD